MTEEQVTKAILSHLTVEGWSIHAYDFPQSGTGKMFYSAIDGKGIIPDIVAVKDDCCLIFENKNRYYLPDFLKLAKLKETGEYNDGLFDFIGRHDLNIETAVGIPVINRITAEKTGVFGMVDFLYYVDNDFNVKVERYNVDDAC